MKIYTRTGDNGTTGLFAGGRVEKDDLRIAAFGDVDELNSVIGVARAQGLAQDIDAEFQQVQCDLFTVGARLATTDPERLQIALVSENDVRRVESWIDRHEDELPDLQHFILPGGCPAAAAIHQARTVGRRAERSVVSLYNAIPEEGYQDIIVMLNRLSDYLFVAARVTNHRAGTEDQIWLGQTDGN